MDQAKRTRNTRSKLQRGLTAKGGEFFFSKRPSSKKSDHAVGKAAKAVSVKSIHVKKKK